MRSAASSTGGCSWWRTGWAGTTPARSPARWPSTRSPASFASHHSEPQQAWPYPVDRSLSLAANLLRNGIKVANDQIRGAAAADRTRTRMGTTVVAMAVGEERLAVAHAGDSRAYRFRAGNVKRLTRDHSVAEEMRAARPEMTDDELATFAHRNVVTRALGSKDDIEPAIYVGHVQPGDLLLAVHGRALGVGSRRKDRDHLAGRGGSADGVPPSGRCGQRRRRSRQRHRSPGSRGLRARGRVPDDPRPAG